MKQLYVFTFSYNKDTCIHNMCIREDTEELAEKRFKEVMHGLPFIVQSVDKAGDYWEGFPEEMIITLNVVNKGRA